MSIDLSRGTQLMDIDYWGHMPHFGGDMNITPSGLEIATDRTGLAIAPKADWATCSTRTNWVQVIPYDAMHVGSHLYAYTQERRFTRVSATSSVSPVGDRGLAGLRSGDRGAGLPGAGVGAAAR